jgi:menaquinone-9 beta-reductase
LKQVAIIGGGLAGLVSGIDLAKKGVPCILFEKKEFPFHKVCGEYISNETVAYLRGLDIFPDELRPKKISRFQLSSIRGQTATMPLDLGGFSISRFSYDHFLAQKALASGVQLRSSCEVVDVSFSGKRFIITTTDGEFTADVVLGAFGKRSKLDVKFERDFIKQRSPYVGVKYHFKNTQHPDDLVSLHNFDGGYCGVVNVENEITNVCYLASRDNFRRFKTPQAFQENVLYENPHLQNIFTRSEISFERPLVINEISFATKQPVENHVLMVGDAAGMITPLCGNGMAIAIHTAKIASGCVWDFCQEKSDRSTLEMTYRNNWKKMFARRLAMGRGVQKLFGSRLVSDLSIRLMMHSRFLSTIIMKNTHGEQF